LLLFVDEELFGIVDIKLTLAFSLDFLYTAVKLKSVPHTALLLLPLLPKGRSRESSSLLWEDQDSHLIFY
jgi:hypothetical protein